jgi:hypothetical protein
MIYAFGDILFRYGTVLSRLDVMSNVRVRVQRYIYHRPHGSEYAAAMMTSKRGWRLRNGATKLRRGHIHTGIGVAYMNVTTLDKSSLQHGIRYSLLLGAVLVCNSGPAQKDSYHRPHQSAYEAADHQRVGVSAIEHSSFD